MPAFEYTALDNAGRKSRGVIEGDSARQVRQQLREMSLAPVAVNEVSTSARHSGYSFHLQSPGISVADLAIATRQLATLSRSGVPLAQALTAVAEQSDQHRTKQVFSAVRSGVLEGLSLAEAMNKHPETFSVLYRATVNAGESAGKLDYVLDELANYMEKRAQLQRNIRLALIYPILLALVSIAIVVGLLVFVIPDIVRVFDSGAHQLPLLTRIMISISEFLRESGVYVLVLLLILFIGWRYIKKITPVRAALDRMILAIPLARKLVRGQNAARFTRTLSILVRSGVPLLDALELASEVVSNRPMREVTRQAAAQVREGGSLSQGLARGKLFPPIAVHLIASGEASGQLDEMLERVAEYQENEMTNTTQTLVSLFEPAMILVMGVIVLLIVLAVLMPIFDLNTMIR